MVIPAPNCAAAGITIPISLLLAVTCAIAFAVGLFPNPKTPLQEQVLFPNLFDQTSIVSMILVEPWKNPSQFLIV
jgi:hypothetical protein